MKNLVTVLCSVGLAGLVGSLFIFGFFVPQILHWRLTQEMKLEEGTLLWKMWAGKPDTEIYFKVYIFNVTNPQEISAGGKPILQEIGPYVYLEKRSNDVIKSKPEKNTLIFRPSSLFYFRPDLSNGSESDVITLLNAPLVGIGNEIKSWSRFSRSSARLFLESYDESLFIKRTVKLALFEGVHMELLESISELLGREYLPNSTFAYFYGKNGTDPAYNLEIFSGVQDNANMGDIILYDGKNKLDIWNGEQCNMINGSDHSVRPPFFTKETVIYAFEPEICRSVHLNYEKEEEFAGILGYRFILPKYMYNSNESFNECFCEESDKSMCLRNGALSISPCKSGTPMIISNPYFLYGDPKYNKDVGLGPGNSKEHEAFLLVEPSTGVMLRGAKRVQVSIQMRKSKDIAQLSNVRDVVVPLFWTDQEAYAGPSVRKVLYNQLVISMRVLEILKWILLATSSFVLIIAATIVTLRSKNKKSFNYIYTMDN